MICKRGENLTDDGVAGDMTGSADVLVAGELVFVSRGIVVGVAVLEVRPLETAPIGPLTVSVATFLGLLATAALEPRPPVVLAAPIIYNIYIYIYTYIC